MALILFAFIAIAILWIVNLWNNRAYLKLAVKAPSNKWHTLLGCGKIMMPKYILKNTGRYAEKYGPNSVFWVGLNPCFLTTDPKTIKEILTSKNCVDKPKEFYNGIVSTASQGLITESDPIWSQHRKLLNKAFSNANLNSFLPGFNTEINQLVRNLVASIDGGKDLDLLPILRELALKNGTKTILKRNLELTKYNSSIMSKHFEEILQFVADITLYKIMSINWIRKLAEILIYKSAREGIDMLSELNQESLDMAQNKDATDASYLSKEKSVIDYVLDDDKEQNTIAVEDRWGMLAHFFVGSFDTTSTLIFFALTLLAMHPEYQELAHEEIKNIVNDNDTDLNMNQLDELVYLEMIMNETMRLLPVVPMVFRKVSNQELSLSNGLTLPIGQIISIDIFRLHRSTELWGPNAEAFNPDNFLSPNVAARHPYSFIPFTKGQRNCIGWRYGTLFFKMALAKLIATFKFSTDFNYKNLRIENHVTLKLTEDPRIRLEQRRKA